MHISKLIDISDYMMNRC